MVRPAWFVYIWGMAVAAEPVRPTHLLGPASSTPLPDFVVVTRQGTELPPSVAPYLDAIGVMSSAGCAVTHVGHGIALTAGHCLLPDGYGVAEGIPCGRSITWGKLDAGSSGLTSACTEVLAVVRSAEQDWAVLRVDPPPPVAIAVERSSPADQGTEIVVIGHPARLSMRSSGTCTLADPALSKSSSLQFSHACPAVGGSSGSPVLRVSDGKMLGIHDGQDQGWGYATSTWGPTLSRFLP